MRDRAVDARDSKLAATHTAHEHRGRLELHRAVSAHDRKTAARDRLSARADREWLVQRLWAAEVDALTGARTRAAGLTELEQALERCRRSTGQLVVAYVDVVGLKHRNDTLGHRAGDELLVCVVELIRAHLRPYDLLVRLGGDEFLCAMSDMTLADARTRFEAFSIALAAGPQAGAITSGFAALAPRETAAELIARADRELLSSRQRNTRSRSTSPSCTTSTEGS
ncbi:MAG: GGDEF domain-containing protein [Solirubrobacteraceae bacterium]